MKVFAKAIFKGLLEVFSVLLLLAAFIFIALAILGTSEPASARIIYALLGLVGAGLGLLLLAWANPKDTEGSLIFVLLSLIGWPR